MYKLSAVFSLILCSTCASSQEFERADNISIEPIPPDISVYRSQNPSYFPGVGTCYDCLPPGDIPGIGVTPNINPKIFDEIVKKNQILAKAQTSAILELQEKLEKIEERLSALEKGKTK